ncbi:hypothetical protein PCANC_06724 [Puccinia coronata f. sp. avenae]|uniref:Uncharacterized protein n=1 Tax=Puccinia coronata f. sp. avenae TaxID=200324 RepID=A0A2N5VDQ6_9BASI|nr:hypothetical protein PCASD_14188 [Puccinia coronata f. sp. avenae]PLW48132.1 hypothetical protein PCANC_06724 [Puccinia coronata f. sp. avenae]
MRWDICLFHIVPAIAVVSATENFNVSPLIAQLWDPWSETSRESFLNQDIPPLARTDRHLEPEAEGQALAPEERDFTKPPVAINTPKHLSPDDHGSLAPLTLTENTANTNHAVALSLASWPC